MAVIRQRAQPAGNQQEPAVGPAAHALTRRREVEQREHGKRQLQAQDDLAQVDQIGDAAAPANADDHDGGQHGERAGDHAPQPRPHAPVHEAFHHHLPGQRAGDRAALAAGQQRHGEQRAGRRRAQQRSQRQVRDADPVAVRAERDDLAAGDDDALLAEEHQGRQDEDGGVDEEGDRQRDGRIDRVEPDRLADGPIVVPDLARLHQRGVQIQVVGHDRGADHADGDVQHAGLAPGWARSARWPISRKSGWVCGSTKISMQ